MVCIFFISYDLLGPRTEMIFYLMQSTSHTTDTAATAATFGAKNTHCTLFVKLDRLIVREAKPNNI